MGTPAEDSTRCLTFDAGLMLNQDCCGGHRCTVGSMWQKTRTEDLQVVGTLHGNRRVRSTCMQS